MPTTSRKFGFGSRLKPDQRLFVESMLASMTPHTVIVKQIVGKYGVKEKTARSWIDKTYELLQADADPVKKDERRAQMRQALGDFYQKALLARQFNSAVVALDRLCKLDGLYTPVELEIADKRGVAERDPDKVRERIRQLAARNPHLVQPTEEQLAGPGEDDPVQ